MKINSRLIAENLGNTLPPLSMLQNRVDETVKKILTFLQKVDDFEDPEFRNMVFEKLYKGMDVGFNITPID